MRLTDEAIQALTIETLMADYDTYICDKWNGYDLPPTVT
jgi:hypothetical protein